MGNQVKPNECVVSKIMKTSYSYRSERFNRHSLTAEKPCLFTAALSLASILSAFVLLASQASAASFFFTTGSPDGKIATLSRPPTPGLIQTETADDFTVTNCVLINQATFTGLIP